MVKRYGWDRGGWDEYPHGNYVHLTDYAALEAENARLRERIEQAPHEFTCARFRCGRCNVSTMQHSKLIHRLGHEFQEQPCNCWKSAP